MPWIDGYGVGRRFVDGRDYIPALHGRILAQDKSEQRSTDVHPLTVMGRDTHGGDPSRPLLGRRDNSAKVPLSMILEARHAMDGVGKVMAFGAGKYSRSNWRKGLKHTEIADSLLRHMTAYLAREDVDEESGMRHVDLILANAIFLAELTVTRPDLDDRGIVIVKTAENRDG